MGVESFAELARPLMGAAGFSTEGHFLRAMELVKDKVRLLTDVPAAAGFLLADDYRRDAAAVEKVRGQAGAAVALSALAAAFRKVEPWSGEAAKNALSEVAVAISVKPGSLMFPMRVALSGLGGGPDIAAILEFLGRERCVARLEAFGKEPV